MSAPLIRVVKLHFRADAVADFLALFAARRAHIRAYPGCTHLALWRDRADPSLFFTYSHWEDEAALNAYRHSELFRATWAGTKPLFAKRAEAWSVTQME